MSNDIEMGFGSFDDGSDGGGGIRSTIFDPGGVGGIDPNVFAEGLNINALFSDFAKYDPESAALLKGLVDPLYTPPDSGESAESETRGTNTTGSDISKLTDAEKNKILTTSFGSATTTGSPNLLQRLLSGNLKEGDLTNLLRGLGAAYMAKKAYDEGQEARNYRRGVSLGPSSPVTATRRAYEGSTYTKAAAQGGIMSLASGGTPKQPFYLGGSTDGMADEVPAHIDNKRPAALSDGEFVIPADVVSHLGNGNSNAGAQRLYKMMDDIRIARTGNPKQGKQINPNKFMPR